MINNALARAYLTGAPITGDTLEGKRPPKIQRAVKFTATDCCTIVPSNNGRFLLYVTQHGERHYLRSYKTMLTAKRGADRVNNLIGAGIFDISEYAPQESGYKEHRAYYTAKVSGERIYLGSFKTRALADIARKHYKALMEQPYGYT